MDHAEARERLELAAVEPGGLERLMAGDTPDSAALAGHLAGCPACQDELRRLHAAVGVIRDVVRSTPPAELRDRTLAYVAALGRARGVDAPGAQAPGAQAPGATEPRGGDVAPVGAVAPDSLASHRRRPGVARWIAGLAAAVVLAIAGTAFVVGTQRDAVIAQRDAELARRADAVAALERITAASLRVAADPDAANVSLEGTGSGTAEASGTLAFSPGSRELVVIATGLPRPAEGREFRCWVEDDGDRRPVGRMYFARDLAFWVGEVDAVSDLSEGSTFGVTLVDENGEALDGAPALIGEL